MALTYGSTKIDGSTTLVSLEGTVAEVRAALATGTGVDTGYEWDGDFTKIKFGGTTSSAFAYYIAEYSE